MVVGGGMVVEGGGGTLGYMRLVKMSDQMRKRLKSSSALSSILRNLAHNVGSTITTSMMNGVIV